MKNPFKRLDYRWNIALVITGIGLFPLLYIFTAGAILFFMIPGIHSGSLESMGYLALFFGPSTLLATAVTGLILLRKKRLDFKVWDIVLAHGVLGGIIYFLLTVLLLLYLKIIDQRIDAFPGIATIFIIGIIGALFLGPIFGAIFAFLLRKPLSFIATWPDSHDSFLETMQVVGAWMARQGIIAVLLIAVLLIMVLLLTTSGWNKTGNLLVIALWLMVAVVGFVLRGIARSRLRVQRDWVAKVAVGEIADWQVISKDRFTAEELSGLRPLELKGQGEETFVLTRRVTGTPVGAYRTSEHVWPEALVSLDADLVASEPR